MIGVEQAQPQEEIIPDIAQPEVVMPAAEFSQLIAKLDCGTGAGGFKPDNDCAKGGGTGSKKKTESQPVSAEAAKHKAINDFEEAKKDQSFESVIVVDKDGKVLFEGDGDETTVTIPPEVVSDLRGTEGLVVSHNHPMGMSFSEKDWETAKSLNVSEIRAVSQEYTYVLRKPEGRSWPTRTPIEMIKEQSEGSIFNKYNDLALQQKISIPKANEEYWNEVTSSIAKHFGISYERIKR
jgi:hypothetical protein